MRGANSPDSSLGKYSRQTLWQKISNVPIFIDAEKSLKGNVTATNLKLSNILSIVQAAENAAENAAGALRSKQGRLWGTSRFTRRSVVEVAEILKSQCPTPMSTVTLN